MREWFCNKDGFMGTTHALSALALFLLCFALVPNFVFGKVLQTENLAVLCASFFVVIGGALVPDFDNTSSTAVSALGGFLGYGVSSFMRSISVFVYSFSHTRYEPDEQDPHRGFWHTIIGGVLFCLCVYWATRISYIVTIPTLDKTGTIGFFCAILWVYFSIRLAVAAILSKVIKAFRSKKVLSQILTQILCVIFSVFVLMKAPEGLDYRWIACSMFLGYIVHLLGDCMTKRGAPILFPLKHKGKRWWFYRFLGGITAGGEIENFVLIPLFLIIIVWSLIFILKYVYF